MRSISASSEVVCIAADDRFMELVANREDLVQARGAKNVGGNEPGFAAVSASRRIDNPPAIRERWPGRRPSAALNSQEPGVRPWRSIIALPRDPVTFVTFCNAWPRFQTTIRRAGNDPRSPAPSLLLLA